MVKVIVQHHVADYDTWYPVFTEHEATRRSHGATGHTIHRAADDPNGVMIVNDFADMAGAQAFATDPTLPDVMHRAGVDSAPQISFVNEAESVRY